MINIIMIIMIIINIYDNNNENNNNNKKKKKNAGARGAAERPASPREALGDQDSSKGGAVETGCRGSHYIIGGFII